MLNVQKEVDVYLSKGISHIQMTRIISLTYSIIYGLCGHSDKQLEGKSLVVS